MVDSHQHKILITHSVHMPISKANASKIKMWPQIISKHKSFHCIKHHNSDPLFTFYLAFYKDKPSDPKGDALFQ